MVQLVINARDPVVLDALAVQFLCEPDLDCDRGVMNGKVYLAKLRK